MSDREMQPAPTATFSPGFSEQFSRLIRDRRTTKVLADVNSPLSIPDSVAKRLNAKVMEAITDAGFAPFHYERRTDGLAEPWRFHVLWQQECRIIGRRLPGWFPDMKPGNKLPGMLAACGALVLVNWLPQFETGVENQKQVEINEEHLAATAAAIQILLLKLTAENLKTYWSSGGQFRSPLMFEKLGIRQQEKMLGAVFVDYHSAGKVEYVGGKNREKRAPANEWTRVLSLDANE